MSQFIDMSLGPVQGFVAQSRRTRDLWGSSYLLSYLSTQAICGAKAAGAKVRRPRVEGDLLYQYVMGVNRPDSKPPVIGSVPNHMIFEVENGEIHDVAEAAKARMKAAWEKVADAVWECFVAHAEDKGEGTRAIWDRQIEDFWELMWIEADNEKEAALFRRKHRRRTWSAPEGGAKCTVMHDYQELSGFYPSASKLERQAQEDFWAKVRKGVGVLDLREDERLSAIALVKRLYPRIAKQALGWEVNRVHWPSTVQMASKNWFDRLKAIDAPALSCYAKTLAEALPKADWMQKHLEALASGDLEVWDHIEANYLYRSHIENPRLCPLAESQTEADRKRLAKALGSLYELKDESGQSLGNPPVFYALLLADGDSLGTVVQTIGADKVGAALGRFTQAVSSVVAGKGGHTIYAGGDDVLAILPVDQALACAEALKNAYEAAFDEAGAAGKATLSAAVVFAHIRLPMGLVLTEAHTLLDDVAKNANGRNSLAAAILKRGGKHCQWVSAWQRSQYGLGGSSCVAAMADLKDRLKADISAFGLSTSLLYRLQHLFALLSDTAESQPGDYVAIAPEIELPAFIQAEVMRTLVQIFDDDKAAQEAEVLAQMIADLIQRERHRGSSEKGGLGEGPSKAENARQAVGFDALALGLFLARGGVEDHE